MPTFALQVIDAIKGNQKFDKLIIDDVCLLDNFENSIGKRYHNELSIIYRYMQVIADCQTLPAKHFKDITPRGESIKEYEFKSKHLRVYAIHQPQGKIVILAGFKTNQFFDIRKLRSIKKSYLLSLKNTENEKGRIIKK
jgi:hypothetical protein